MRRNDSGWPDRRGCTGIRAVAITVRPVNIDGPAMSCRGCIRDNERSGIHGCSPGLDIHRAPFKERPPVLYAQVLHGLTTGRSSAPEDISFPGDVGQVLLARNSKNGIANRCRKRCAGAPANDMGTLVHVCAAAQKQRENESKAGFHARCRTESAHAPQAKTDSYHGRFLRSAQL
jgi:hypothetical protein